MSDSDAEAVNVASPIQFPSDACFQAVRLEYSHCEKDEGVRQDFAPFMASDVVLSTVPLQIVYHEDYFQGNQFGPLVNFANHAYSDLSIFESRVENATMVIHDDEKSLGEFHS